METMKLSQRLKQVASFVPEGARVLDVGSDHAYLPIYLIQQGRIQQAIAGEVVEGPYQSAVKNVAEQGLSAQIEVRLANGLAAFEPTDGVSAIVIAGMGGRLIADILENGRAKLSSVDRLILQPNNREDDLRRWLSNHDFQIVAEDILEEAGKIYEILVVEAGQQDLTAQDLRFGPFLRKEQSPVFRAKWQKELGKLTYALQQIPEKNEADRSFIQDKIQQIKEVLHVSE